jgi:hypothetical protein
MSKKIIDEQKETPFQIDNPEAAEALFDRFQYRHFSSPDGIGRRALKLTCPV